MFQHRIKLATIIEERPGVIDTEQGA